MSGKEPLKTVCFLISAGLCGNLAVFPAVPIPGHRNHRIGSCIRAPLKAQEKLTVDLNTVFEIHTRNALADGADKLIWNGSRELREGLDGVMRPEDLDLVADADSGKPA